jgi:similar to stage IV sporulation protein
MMGRWIQNIFRGYVVVTIRGRNVATWINTAVQEGIDLWDVRRAGPDQFLVSIAWKDFWRIRPLLRRAGCKARVHKKSGAPFWKRSLRRRPVFVLGAVLFVLLLWGSSQIVWTVHVEGNHSLEDEEILSVAESVGLRPGMWIPGLPDTDVLQAELLDKMPKLAWVGIRIQGTAVYIQVVEKIPGVEKNPSVPQHIVAGARGVIEQILVRKGVAHVQRGMLVEPGQLLISGVVGPDGQQTVSAEGTVLAHVWYTSDVEIPMTFVREGLTGEKISRTYLLLGQWPLLLWGHATIPFADYQERAEDEMLAWGKTILPLGLRRVDYYEVDKVHGNRRREEALQKALETASNDVLAGLPRGGRVAGQKVLKEEQKNGKLYVRVWTDVLEDIGVPKPIVAAPQTPAPAPPTTSQ